MHIEVAGVVQGVGFRPFVHNLAEANHLTGFVGNTSSGVVIEVEGGDVDGFVQQLRANPPPLAQVLDFCAKEIAPKGDSQFEIIKSSSDGGSTLVSPDATVCGDCLRELMDPRDRRFLYPFINCTNCGPRYSITTDIPYDRPNTTMAAFPLCDDCSKEYEDPTNRRFHAQPNACPACGPQVELIFENEKHRRSDAIRRTIELLKAGKIVAIKGIGGFHLAADADNVEAVKELRRRKRKSNKAFALMAPSVEAILRHCRITAEEEELLISNERPIVLLGRRNRAVPHHAAPNSSYLGFMLPYAPLHYLLFYMPMASVGDSINPNFNALIMTSGNFSDEPIAKDNQDTKRNLGSLADAFLTHDRPIFMRVDDSVVRRASNQTVFLRRARGYAPCPIDLGQGGPEVLACGADLKNAFTLTKGRAAIVSQHIGDFENFETLQFFEETLENLKKVYRSNPCRLAHDLHPDYHSTKWALDQKVLPTWGVQHHYAHIASAMAERGLKEKVLGVALDGTGYGPDGSIWGGEIMICDVSGFDRIGCFKPIALPGGEAAIKNPWMTAVSIIQDVCGEAAMDRLDSLGYIDRCGEETIANTLKIAGSKNLSPMASSAGRLFEAVSSLLDYCHVNTYEGEAAVSLEANAAKGVADSYPYSKSDAEPFLLDFSETMASILKDLRMGKIKAYISAKFHNTIIRAILESVDQTRKQTGIENVALSGGVFQNAYILSTLCLRLADLGLNPIFNTKVPCNDGGISLGQAYLLRERLKIGELS